jgi:hypothetical protein
LLAEPLEPVEQDVQRELELELLVAAASGGRLAVGCPMATSMMWGYFTGMSRIMAAGWAAVP